MESEENIINSNNIDNTNANSKQYEEIKMNIQTREEILQEKKKEDERHKEVMQLMVLKRRETQRKNEILKAKGQYKDKKQRREEIKEKKMRKKIIREEIEKLWMYIFKETDYGHCLNAWPQNVKDKMQDFYLKLAEIDGRPHILEKQYKTDRCRYYMIYGRKYGFKDKTVEKRLRRKLKIKRMGTIEIMEKRRQRLDTRIEKIVKVQTIEDREKQIKEEQMKIKDEQSKIEKDIKNMQKVIYDEKDKIVKDIQDIQNTVYIEKEKQEKIIKDINDNKLYLTATKEMQDFWFNNKTIIFQKEERIIDGEQTIVLNEKEVSFFHCLMYEILEKIRTGTAKEIAELLKAINVDFTTLLLGSEKINLLCQMNQFNQTNNNNATGKEQIKELLNILDNQNVSK